MSRKGMLTKFKGGMKGRAGKRTSTSYFFKLDKMYFSYSETKHATEPKQFHILSDIVGVSFDKSRECTFEVRFRKGDSWLLAADSLEDAFGWMEALKPGSTHAIRQESAQHGSNRGRSASSPALAVAPPVFPYPQPLPPILSRGNTYSGGPVAGHHPMTSVASSLPPQSFAPRSPLPEAPPSYEASLDSSEYIDIREVESSPQRKKKQLQQQKLLQQLHQHQHQQHQHQHQQHQQNQHSQPQPHIYDTSDMQEHQHQQPQPPQSPHNDMQEHIYDMTDMQEHMSDMTIDLDADTSYVPMSMPSPALSDSRLSPQKANSLPGARPPNLGESLPEKEEAIYFELDDPRNKTVKYCMDKLPKLEMDKLKLMNKLAEGNFGVVYQGIYKIGNLSVAAKLLKDECDEKDLNDMIKEAYILNQLNHPNVVRFYGLGWQEGNPVLVLEFLDNGALDEFVEKYGREKSLKQLVHYILDVLSAMVYLSRRAFVHRDLAARNVLVSRSEQCKLSDFGLSRELAEPDGMYLSQGGRVALKWAAPESLNHRRFTTASDVWSCGVLMWEVLSFGKEPYEALNMMATLSFTSKGGRLSKPEICPPAIYALMKRCWQDDEAMRPNFDDIYRELFSLERNL